MLDERHVGEDAGVAGEVERAAVGEAQHVAAGFAAVDDLLAVLYAATVYRVGHGDGGARDRLRAALFMGQMLATPFDASHRQVS